MDVAGAWSLLVSSLRPSLALETSDNHLWFGCKSQVN